MCELVSLLFKSADTQNVLLTGCFKAIANTLKHDLTGIEDPSPLNNNNEVIDLRCSKNANRVKGVQTLAS
jgi:hypothetical protein